jgi:hypothetical protein
MQENSWVGQVKKIFTSSHLFSFLNQCKHSRPTSDLLRHSLFDAEVAASPSNQWASLLTTLNCFNNQQNTTETKKLATEENKDEVNFICHCNDGSKVININFVFNTESEDPDEVMRSLAKTLQESGYFKFEEDLTKLKSQLIDMKEVKNNCTSTNKNITNNDKEEAKENRDENLDMVTDTRINNKTETETDYYMGEEISDILPVDNDSSGPEDTIRNLISNK